MNCVSEFNAMPVDDWKSGDFYGVSIAGAEWLEMRGFNANGESFNTYNWGSKSQPSFARRRIDA